MHEEQTLSSHPSHHGRLEPAAPGGRVAPPPQPVPRGGAITSPGGAITSPQRRHHVPAAAPSRPPQRRHHIPRGGAITSPAAALLGRPLGAGSES